MEALEVLENDQTIELSPWLSISIPPERKGVFQVHDTARDQDEHWFTYFDGGRYHGAWGSPAEAFKYRHLPSVGSITKTFEWRGLTAEPDADVHLPVVNAAHRAFVRK